MRNRKIKRLTFTALMTAAAVVLSFAEGLFPASAFLPPGSRLGLSNIPVMFAASALSIGETMLIVVAKAFFVLITRGFTAFLMSLCGGVLSALCMLLIFRRFKSIGCVGTGVLSALCHNAGQLLVSFIIIDSAAVFGYAPVMIIAAAVTGVLTGSVLRAAMPYFYKMNFVKEMEK
ncbi:MAG: Gx transporter family protein [Candidatus Fimenecus sp.]